jgi:glycosyltransferase involved in cell wall biosynthesis
LDSGKTIVPKATIVIPTYNRAVLLKEAVNSVLNQSFSDFEITVVDDGSIDDTREVIGEIQDSRIKYFYKENGGVASARNFGFQKSRGIIICNLDSDDYWPNNFLEIMIFAMEKNPSYGAAYAKRTILYPDGTMKEYTDIDYPKSGWITKELFLRKSKVPVHTSGTCFRRDVLEGIMYDERLQNSADFDYWLRLSTKSQFLFVPDASFIYRAGHSVNPRTSFSRENGNRIRILERFYFQLEGKDMISRKQAFRKISHSYYSVGKTHFRMKHRAAAISMFKHAIRYWPCDLRLYSYCLRAFFMRKNKDNAPDWRLPDPL